MAEFETRIRLLRQMLSKNPILSNASFMREIIAKQLNHIARGKAITKERRQLILDIDGILVSSADHIIRLRGDANELESEIAQFSFPLSLSLPVVILKRALDNYEQYIRSTRNLVLMMLISINVRVRENHSRLDCMETCVDSEIFQVVSRATDIAMMMTKKEISSKMYRTALAEIGRLREFTPNSSICENVLSMTTSFINEIFRQRSDRAYEALELLQNHISRDKIEGKLEGKQKKKVNVRHILSKWKRPKGDVANLFRSHHDLSSAYDNIFF